MAVMNMPVTRTPREMMFGLQRELVEKSMMKKQWCERCPPRRRQQRRRSLSIESRTCQRERGVRPASRVEGRRIHLSDEEKSLKVQFPSLPLIMATLVTGSPEV